MADALPPYGPDDFNALQPTASSSWCDKLLGLPGRMTFMVAKMIAWAINTDLTASDNLKAWLSLTTTGLTAPIGVSASDGNSATEVTVTWGSVGTALSYSIWRGLTNDTSTMTQIGTATTTTYSDTTATLAQVYFYAVKALNATATTGFSATDSGYSQTGGGGATSQSFAASGSFVVPNPLASNKIGIKMWAPGGTGGNPGSSSPWAIPSIAVATAGGGGGGGQYVVCTLAGQYITVTPGETLTVQITAASCSILRGTTPLLWVLAGSDGQQGSAGGGGGAGGTGGSYAAGTVGAVFTAGSAGSAHSGYNGGAGGATTPVESGYGTGGAGGHGSANSGSSPFWLDKTNGVAGLGGKVVINW